ncbi:MAG: hypothetical protein LBJ71_03095 [Holosporaceae bacterium]|jgi:hypothetical protein|nr:hypothetical protein [Holosporaceae bacterium]
MKKILVLSMIACSSMAAYADEEGQIVNTEENCTDPFSGCYFALGIGGSFLENKARTEAIVQNVSGIVEASQKENNIVGTTVFGAGKVFTNSIYLGGEALVNFGKTKKYGNEHNGIKFDGIVPALALRTGLVKNDFLFFIKLGAAFPRTTVACDLIVANTHFAETLKVSKPSFVAGLGVEKVLCRKFSGRLEGEYSFGQKKTVKLAENAYAKGEAAKGFNIRALIAYNVKF